MKKFVVLYLAGFMILAFGATGYAQKLDFRASGSVDVQSHWMVNTPPLNPGATPIYNSLPPDYKYAGPVGTTKGGAIDRKVAYWDTRFALRFDAVMGKEMSGTLQFEIDATRWGNNSPAGAREAGLTGYWSADRTGVEVKYMYLDFTLPYLGIPVPMDMRAGVQPLVIRPGFLGATDGSGLSGNIKLDPFIIRPLYFKAAEGVDWTADDVDIYGLQLSAKLGAVTIGGYGLYYNMNSYPWFGTGSALTEGTQKGNFGWLGLYADGKAGPVNFNFDFGYDHGKVNSTRSNVEDVKYRGWAGRLKIDYPWEKYNLGIIGMYATGSDAEDTSDTGLAGSTTPYGTVSTKVRGWMVPVGAEHGALNMESAVFYGMEPGASGGNGIAVTHNYNYTNKGAFGGTWFAKIYGSCKVAPVYKITLQGLYIGDTTKNANTYGSARNAPYGATNLRDDKNIGFELDLINEFQIYKNLVFKVFGGYLWAGDAMELYSGNTTVGNFEMKNPWAIRTRLLYTF